MTAKKLCRVCGVRTIATGKGNNNDQMQAKAVELCIPCLEEAEWENTHSDDDHAGTPEGYLTDACWICHPELNLAKKDHTPRTGHTNTVAHGWNSHGVCYHPRTPKDRARCRAAGGPGSEGSLKLFPAPLTSTETDETPVAVPEPTPADDKPAPARKRAPRKAKTN